MIEQGESGRTGGLEVRARERAPGGIPAAGGGEGEHGGIVLPRGASVLAAWTRFLPGVLGVFVGLPVALGGVVAVCLGALGGMLEAVLATPRSAAAHRADALAKVGLAGLGFGLALTLAGAVVIGRSSARRE